MLLVVSDHLSERRNGVLYGMRDLLPELCFRGSNVLPQLCFGRGNVVPQMLVARTQQKNNDSDEQRRRHTSQDQYCDFHCVQCPPNVK